MERAQWMWKEDLVSNLYLKSKWFVRILLPKCKKAIAIFDKKMNVTLYTCWWLLRLSSPPFQKINENPLNLIHLRQKSIKFWILKKYLNSGVVMLLNRHNFFCAAIGFTYYVFFRCCMDNQLFAGKDYFKSDCNEFWANRGARYC